MTALAYFLSEDKLGFFSPQKQKFPDNLGNLSPSSTAATSLSEQLGDF